MAILAMSVAGAVVSGGITSGSVASATLRGIGPCRLYVKNSGAADLTDAEVRIGPDADNLLVADDSTFAALQAGEMTSLRIEGPVNAVAFAAGCASDTTVDVWLADSARIVG